MATFMLVHGAGTGGWLWDDVAAQLRAAGHRVHAPSLHGVGDNAGDHHPATIDVSTHAGQITAALDTIGSTQVVLVGFSYGGVITTVADAVPHRISRLVYLDAFVPQAGRCFLDVLPPPVRAMLEAAAARSGDRRHIPPAPVQTVGGIGRWSPVCPPTTLTRCWPAADRIPSPPTGR